MHARLSCVHAPLDLIGLESGECANEHDTRSLLAQSSPLQRVGLVFFSTLQLDGVIRPARGRVGGH